MEKINWALVLSASLAAAGTVASATKSALKADAAHEMATKDHDTLMRSSSQAEAALNLATRDHDAIVRLETLMPRLERVVDRIEQGDKEKRR